MKLNEYIKKFEEITGACFYTELSEKANIAIPFFPEISEEVDLGDVEMFFGRLALHGSFDREGNLTEEGQERLLESLHEVTRKSNQLAQVIRRSKV